MNHLRAFWPIVDRTSAFITALSILETISKRDNPRTVRIIADKDIVKIIAFLVDGSIAVLIY
ncbi:MAG: hypothetical protein M1365_12465 [Actinobacteria bacterium]|nr:hypothetical protein [Actinomycetota bacterium]